MCMSTQDRFQSACNRFYLIVLHSLKKVAQHLLEQEEHSKTDHLSCDAGVPAAASDRGSEAV